MERDSPFWRRVVEATPELTKEQRSPWLQKLCSVGQSTVSRWKSGENLPTMESVIEISNETGFCVQYLFTGGGPRRWDEPRSPELDQAISVLSSLDDETKQEVLRFAIFRRDGGR